MLSICKGIMKVMIIEARIKPQKRAEQYQSRLGKSVLQIYKIFKTCNTG